MSSAKKHINIPVFIPHLGCPNNCVFCNQRSISGKKEFVAESVIPEIEEVLSTVKPNQEAEIAFFGGSFTGIDRELMISLLEIGQKYIDSGKVSGLRLSTRPDYISPEIIEILSRYGVKTVELGIQSMDDKVLKASKRGHTKEQTEAACKMIKNAGFSLIGQMMVGLPEADVESEKNTARRICEMGADGARIYPTVVFYDTELCEMSKEGRYTPLSEADAVERTKEVLKVFDFNGVPCIRIGLCASENLSSPDTVYGGANHSAIGEMAISELFYEKMDELLANLEKRGRHITFYVSKGCTSKAVGQKRKNILRLCSKYSLLGIKIVEKSEILGYNIIID